MIGIFDSGVGGLAVYLPLKKALPNEQFLYLADQAFAPYGEKSNEEIVERMKKVVKWMVKRIENLSPKLYNLKPLIVIACNTATVNAIDILRKEFPEVEFVGIEPAIKPAAATCNNIIVLGTNSTVNNPRYRALVDKFATGKQVWNIGAPELVRQVEAGDLESTSLIENVILSETKDLDSSSTTNVGTQNDILSSIEAIVIGCTHFSFLKPAITKKWPHIQIFDGADGVVRRAVDRYNSVIPREAKDLDSSAAPQNDSKAQGSIVNGQMFDPRDQFYTTGLSRRVDFVDPPIDFEPVEI